MGCEKCPSILVTGNNTSPIGIGSYRLPIVLEPIVQGVRDCRGRERARSASEGARHAYNSRMPQD